ncbi:DNA-formamidopyrimidine glycosylase, partial [Xanthomonas citri pv. citri]|nr:DNA-formamidopyrimidine glycosylase [Xanthomonas citri pv. citri]
SINKTRKHDYIIFELDNQMFLFYNDSRQFGTFHIKNDNELFSSKPLDKLGKEVDKIDPKNLYESVRNKSIPIKSFLLDQSYILGI